MRPEPSLRSRGGNSLIDSKLEQEKQGSGICVKVLSIPGSRRRATQAHSTTQPALLRLSDHLLANYKKGVRPVRDWRKPTLVSIDVIMYAILNVVSCP